MNKICGIYKITSPSGKIYIGQSKDIDKRKFYYKNLKCKTQPKIYYSLKKHGWENHKFEIIHECEKDELNELEIYYIKFYDCFDTKCGMNLTSGGQNRILSKETKIKIGLASKNRICSNETRKKLSNAIKGIKRSKETINNMKSSKTGLKHTEETKQKIRDHKCGTYEIYNQNNELVYKFHSNIKKEFKNLNFPEHRFCDSYRYNTKIKNGSYKDWYVIKL